LIPGPERVDHEVDGPRRFAPARIIDMVTDERRKPVLQHPVESSGFNVMRDQVLRHIGEPEARKRRVEPPMR